MMQRKRIYTVQKRAKISKNPLHCQKFRFRQLGNEVLCLVQRSRREYKAKLVPQLIDKECGGT